MPKFSRFIVLGLAAAAALALTAPALAWHSAFPHSRNMVALGESPQPNDGEFNSDIAFWGNYAFEGSYDGFRILDISNPSAPTEVTEVKCGASQGDVTISPDGNILVRSQDSGRILPGNDPNQACSRGTGGSTVQGWEGLQIFDVSNKAAPRFVKAVFTDFGSHTHTQYYDRANNRLVIYASRGGTSGPTGGYGTPSTSPYGGQNWAANTGCITAVTVPLDNPTAAAVANRCIVAGTGGCHDVMVYEGMKRLYGACRPNMILYDTTDPVNPRQIHDQQYPTITGWHSAGMSWDGKLLFAGWEPGGGSAPRCMATGTPTSTTPGSQSVQTDAQKSIFVFRASDGTLVGRWVLPREQNQFENCTIHNYAFVPFVDRHVLVQGSYQSGSSVVQFSPLVGEHDWVGQEVAWVDPPPLASTLVLGGAWSTHWYNGEIYESDIPRGVAIYTINEPWWQQAIDLPYLNPQTMGDRLTCRVTAASPALRQRKRSTVRATVRVNGQTTAGMTVRLTGAGVNRAVKTNSNGVAAAAIRPSRAGSLRVMASSLNVAACSASKRVARAAVKVRRGVRGGGTGGAALTGRVR
jgi:hypothetical protein